MTERPFTVNTLNGTIVCGAGFRVEDFFPGEGSYCSLVSDSAVDALLWCGAVLHVVLGVAAAVQSARIGWLMPRSKRPLRQVLLIHVMTCGSSLSLFAWNLGRVLTRNSSDVDVARSWTYKYGGAVRLLFWSIPNSFIITSGLIFTLAFIRVLAAAKLASAERQRSDRIATLGIGALGVILFTAHFFCSLLPLAPALAWLDRSLLLVALMTTVSVIFVWLLFGPYVAFALATAIERSGGGDAAGHAANKRTARQIRVTMGVFIEVAVLNMAIDPIMAFRFGMQELFWVCIWISVAALGFAQLIALRSAASPARNERVAHATASVVPHVQHGGSPNSAHAHTQQLKGVHIGRSPAQQHDAHADNGNSNGNGNNGGERESQMDHIKRGSTTPAWPHSQTTEMQPSRPLN